MLTVGTVINGAMRQVREHPLAMFVWGLLYAAITMAGVVALFVPLFQTFATNAARGPPPDPALMVGMIGEIYLFDFALLLLFSILMTAGFRAAFRPEERAFAYLRLGMDELRQVVLALLMFIGLAILTLAGAMIIGILLAALGMATGAAGGHAPAGMILLLLLVYIPPTYLLVRFSLAFPLTMVRGRITIGEAWRFTAGRFWTLFGGYLVLGLIFFVVYVAAALIFFAIVSGITQISGPLAMVTLMQGHPGGAMLALLIAGGVILILFSGASIAVFSGATAAATQALLGYDETDLAETFA